MDLRKIGFNKQFLNYQKNDLDFARVVLEHKHIYRVTDGVNDWLAELSGKFRFNALTRTDYPAVGDWVLIKKLPNENRVIIHEVLPRLSCFSRKTAGSKIEEQIVATNVDYVFLVNALNNDFNVRRIERYLTLAWESGANPIIILTKKDLCEDVSSRISAVEEVAIGVPILAVNSIDGDGIDAISEYASEGKTVALLGSSGAGKSTLLNALIGTELQKTQDVREGDDRGKHTTTHRELFFLPSGGMIIDTPGMRELQLWDGDEGVTVTFSDIEEIALRCRFSDCSHESEPGCAIRSAIENGELETSRYESYLKLQREIAYSARKQDSALARAEKEKWKKIHLQAQQHMDLKYRRKR
ncbi:MAG: rsgA [Bacillales bacterium]|jgi:ribosome biogenesis GTPase|nr:rsgA [Bacillales bacterium]